MNIWNTILALICFTLAVVTSFLFLFVYRRFRLDIMKKAFSLSLVSNVFVLMDFIRIVLSQDLYYTGDVRIYLYYLSIVLFGALYYTFLRFYHVLLYRQISGSWKWLYLLSWGLPLIIFVIHSIFHLMINISDILNLLLSLFIFAYFLQTIKAYIQLKNNLKKKILLIFIILDILILTVMVLDLSPVIFRQIREKSYNEYYVYILFNSINITLIIRYFTKFKASKVQSSDARMGDFSEMYEKISSREWDIIHLIMKGYSNQKIADHLFIHLNTVKTHIYHIYQKTHARNRIELINYINNTQK